MLRTILEASTGPMTDSEFEEILDLTTRDILINRVGFGRLTNLAGVVQVAEISFIVLRRGQVA